MPDRMSGNGMPATGQPGGSIGRDFSAPLGSATSGRLIFSSGASNVTVHADPTTEDLYRARFEGNVPTLGVQGGTVTVRYPRFSSFDWLHYRRDSGGRSRSTPLSPGTSRCATAHSSSRRAPSRDPRALFTGVRGR